MASEPHGRTSLFPNKPVDQYALELFYQETPVFEGAPLLAAIRRRCPDMMPSPIAVRPGSFIFAHQDHPAAGNGPRVPVQRAIIVSPSPPEPGRCEASLAQSWSWTVAPQAVSACRATVLVTDLFAAELSPLHRLILVENVLAALVEAYPPTAIHWQPTQQFVDPQAFLAAYRAAGGMVLAPGPLNVRLFRDEPAASAEAPAAEPGGDTCQREILMDTLGLAALGLPDVQCRFRAIPPAAVSRVLYNTAIYMMQQGSLIDDQHTVPGVEPESRWVCRRTESTALPARIVLDLAPDNEPTPAE